MIQFDFSRSHGTYRPRLKSLVQQNPATDVKDATREAFNCYNSATPNAAIAKLTALKGIGPATASLLLSVYTSEAPFFSDELYRWAFFESGDTKGRGWDRPIKYNGKEYAALFNRVQELRERLQVSAVEAEKVAYVLGKGEATATSSGQKLEKSRKRKAEQSDDARVSRTRKGS